MKAVNVKEDIPLVKGVIVPTRVFPVPPTPVLKYKAFVFVRYPVKGSVSLTY